MPGKPGRRPGQRPVCGVCGTYGHDRRRHAEDRSRERVPSSALPTDNGDGGRRSASGYRSRTGRPVMVAGWGPPRVEPERVRVCRFCGDQHEEQGAHGGAELAGIGLGQRVRYLGGTITPAPKVGAQGKVTFVGDGETVNAIVVRWEPSGGELIMWPAEDRLEVLEEARR
jgi:hypothetical protein